MRKMKNLNSGGSGSSSGGSSTTRGRFESYLYKFFAENERKKIEKNPGYPMSKLGLV